MPGQVKLKGQGFWKRPLTHLAENHTVLVEVLDHRQGSHRQLDLFAAKQNLAMGLENMCQCIATFCWRSIAAKQGDTA